jgi:hypothetical protein
MKLWNRPDQKNSVDHLEEAIRRLSLAYGVEDIANVRMKGVTRPRKVRDATFLRFLVRTYLFT